MILITIPIWQDNAAQAEQMLEFIFAQNDRAQINGHCLLVMPPTVPEDMKARIKISAELAFSGVHMLDLRPLSDPVAPKWKCINSVFTQTADHIYKSFRWPWFLMEPDTVPTARGWLPRLVMAYGQQPKSYLGPMLKIATAGKPDAFIMARCAVYPVNAIQNSPIADAPYEVTSAVHVLPKLTTTKIIQHTLILNEEDLAKVRPDAVLIHGDKNGFLRRQLEVSFSLKQEEQEPVNLNRMIGSITLPVTGEVPPLNPETIAINGTHKKRGRPSKAQMEARAKSVQAALNGN